MRTSRGIAARIAYVYAAAASAWILVSGWWAFSLPKPLEGIAELVKGLLFVLLTSFLLYWVISRWTDALAQERQRAEEAHRQLQQVVDTVPAGVVFLDCKGAVSFMNPSAGRLLGVSPSASVGMAFEMLLGAEKCADFAAAIGQLLSTGAIDGLELDQLPGRSARALTARAVEIDPKSPGAGWIVALADQTATHAELAKSARLLAGYRCISEMTGLIGSAASTDQLMQQVCDVATSIGGFTAAWAMAGDENGGIRLAGSAGMCDAAREVSRRVTGATKTEAVRMLDRLCSTELWVENDLAAQSDEPWRVLTDDCGLGSVAMFGIVEDGRLRAGLALFATAAGFFDAEEKRLVATLRNDIAMALDRLALEDARLQAEAALAESAEDYRRLFDANPQAMYVHSREDLTFLAVNNAAVKKYGYSRDQFAHMSIKDIRPPSEVPQLLEHLRHTEPRDVLTDAGFWTHRDATGREFPVHTRTHAIRWEGLDAVLVLVEEVAKMA